MELLPPQKLPSGKHPVKHWSPSLPHIIMLVILPNSSGLLDKLSTSSSSMLRTIACTKDGNKREMISSRTLTAGASKFTGTQTLILSATRVLWTLPLAYPSPHISHSLTTSLSTREYSLILSNKRIPPFTDISMQPKTDGSGSEHLIRLSFMSNSMMVQSTATSSTSSVASLLTQTFSSLTSVLPSAATHSLLFLKSQQNSHLHSKFLQMMQLHKFLQRPFL